MEIKEYTATGKTVEIALENAKAALGIDMLDGYDFQIISQPKSGFLGIGASPAKVRVFEIVSEPVAAEEEKRSSENKAEEKKNTEKKHSPKKHSEHKQKSCECKCECEKENTAQEPEVKTPIDENCAALAFVRTTLKNLGLSATADGYIDEEGIKRIVVKGSDATMLIGHHGDTLDAFQYLANLAANREFKSGDKNHNRVTVDIEDYRSKREQTLRALARRMAAKTLKYGKSVMLEPMNPYERRIIHSEIQGIEGVSTNSIGSENNRKVVIYLTDGKQKKNQR